MQDFLRKSCLICQSNKIQDIIDLGMHPFADKFIKENDKYLDEKIFPLVVCLCRNCGNIQQKIITKPEARYSDNEYSYTSSNSNYSRLYWKDFANDIVKIKSGTNLKILEIGSNDGYLLSLLKKFNSFVLGIDPSPNMNKLAKKRGINTLQDLFSLKNIYKIKKIYKKFDLVIANNVLNHSNDPGDFFRGIKKILKEDGLFITENPYWPDTIAKGFFDQIYHEHVSYFTIKSILKICENNNLYIYDIIKTKYHGSSIKIIIGFDKKKETKKKISKFIKIETNKKIFNYSFYKKLMKKINYKKLKFIKKLINLKLQSKKIICIGASAKGNTFLNFYGLNTNLIDFVTDLSPEKIGKLTPLSRIPIKSDYEISKIEKPYIILTAWNLSNILRKKIKKINSNFKILNPFA